MGWEMLPGSGKSLCQYRRIVWKVHILTEAYMLGDCLIEGPGLTKISLSPLSNVKRDYVSGRKILLCATLVVALGVFIQYLLLELGH